MRKIYLAPMMTSFELKIAQIIATSTVDISVQNEEYNGAGRTKEKGNWDVWEE